MWTLGAYHLIPPTLLVYVFDRRDGFEDSRIVDQDIRVSVLLLDLLKQCGYRRRVRDVGGNGQEVYF
jgi:hypothetical protein